MSEMKLYLMAKAFSAFEKTFGMTYDCANLNNDIAP
jgi:hypothetical protein